MVTEASYRVGAATAEITPDLSRRVYLAGFAANRTATSVLHPLTAGALYIEDRHGDGLCFVTLDLIGLLNPDVQRLQELLAPALPRERVVVCSTHTHSGPDTLGLWGPAVAGLPYRSGVNGPLLERIIAVAAEAAREAVATARPAEVRAITFTPPGDWVRNDRKGGGLYPEAVALSAWEGDKPFAVMLNFAAHPEALWEDNRALSPDYPGPWRHWLQEQGIAHPLFFSGPIGAMLTPNVPARLKLAERVKYVDFFGRMLAKRTLAEMYRSERLSGPVRVARRSLSLVNANRGFAFARRLDLLNRPMEDGNVRTEVVSGRIGNWRFATVPGEPAPEVGHELARILGGRHKMLLALGQDELGYIIPPASFRDREYKYEQTMSLGPHTAPAVADAVTTLQDELDHE